MEQRLDRNPDSKPNKVRQLNTRKGWQDKLTKLKCTLKIENGDTRHKIKTKALNNFKEDIIKKNNNQHQSQILVNRNKRVDATYKTQIHGRTDPTTGVDYIQNKN